MIVSASSQECFSSRVIAHELGHAFGLEHDSRADAYVMSYGRFLDPRTRALHAVEPHRLSASTAEWLDVHSAFNPRPSNKIDTVSQINLLSQRLISAPNTLSLRFQVIDPEGIHQVRLSVFSGVEYVLVSSKLLDGSKSTTVEFVTSDLVRSNGGIDISVNTIDVSGNFVECSAYFRLDETILHDTYLRALEGSHEGWIKSIAFSRDGKRILAGDHGSAYLWNTSSGRLIRTLDTQNGGAGTAVSFTPNGARIAAINSDGSVSLWNINTSRRIRTFEGQKVKLVSFSPNGKKIATVNVFA